MLSLRDIHRAAGATALAVLLFGASAHADDPLDPLAMLPGLWGWVPQDGDPEQMPGTCAHLPMRIWFSEGGTRYNSQWSGDEAVFTSPIYTWLPADGDSAGFLIQYDDEDRTDADGNPVAWFLFMMAPDRFVWIRRDWVESGGSTRPMERCEDTPIG